MARKDLYSEIAKIAYEIYVQRGCVHGNDIDQWLEAERLVLSNHVPKPKKNDKAVKTLKTSPAKKITKTPVKKTKTKKTPKPTRGKSVEM